MKIRDVHLYHGAALNQIAEDRHFTAINAFKLNGQVSRASFRVNDDIGVYLKHRNKPKSSFEEYQFTFNTEHLQELEKLSAACARVFVALICVKDGHICCLPYDEFQNLIEKRRHAKGSDEEQYQLLAVLPEGSAFRVYVNRPGVRKRSLGEIKIPRNAFPSALFASGRTSRQARPVRARPFRVRR